MIGGVIKIFHLEKLFIRLNAMKKIEYPELLDETLVSLNEACKCFPVSVSRPSIERLWRRGQRGIVLKTVFLVGRRYTSTEEIKRFLVATQRTGDGTPAVPTPSISNRDIVAARKKHNLPTAGKNGIADEQQLTDSKEVEGQE